MVRTIKLAATVLSIFSFATMETISAAAADSESIGTVSARGNFRVDSHLVSGNATLFNGSMVETGTATADLRMGTDATITMSTNSRGTLYRDRLVLQQGESQLTAPEAFYLEVEGLRVAPSAPKSQGIVSLESGNTVQVSALSGKFSVTNDHGFVLASIRPGRAMTFAFQSGSSGTAFTGTGKVTFSNGQYYLTLKSTGVKYELKGDGLSNLVGKEVTVTGTLETPTSPTGGSIDIVDILSKRVVGGGLTGTSEAIIAGVIVGASVGTAVGIYEADQSKPPASQ